MKVFMDPRTSVINKRLENIDNIISVASGKGGVGKSLVASGLALLLSKKGYNVGLLDLDLYGPSTHTILGITPKGFPEEDKGITPEVFHGIKYMSIVYFTEDKPGAFRGVDISNIIIELLSITQWKKMDYLIIDMPPGIGDETLDVINLIEKSKFLVVTTSSKVSWNPVEKLLRILAEIKVPIAGIVENMKIENSDYIFDNIHKMNLKYLGSIAFDSDLENCIGRPEELSMTGFMSDLQKIIKFL